ncbi:hypothetical protein C2S51_008102 [Perilla frutescens var. frutescens]|nr:hypothetical protein C2S51_008102 [Perilla frutescens var. frutescens]
MSESMLGYVTRCQTSRDMWIVLASLFQSSSKARVMQLRLQLQTQKKGDQSVEDFFFKMRGLADLLAAAGQPVSDEDLTLHILAGFGGEYDAVVVNLTNRSESLNLQEVQYALQAHEIRRQIHSMFEFPAAKPINGGRGFFNRGRGGRGYSRESKINASNALTRTVYDQEGAMPWFVDSGATTHVTNDLRNLNVSSQLTVGNGNVLLISLVGSSEIKAHHNATSLLNNILYVPEITKNLVSNSQFTKDNGVYVEFHHDMCFVKDRLNHKVVMKGTLRKGLYQLDISTLQLQKDGIGVHLVQNKASQPSALGSGLASFSSVIPRTSNEQDVIKKIPSSSQKTMTIVCWIVLLWSVMIV